MNVFRVAVSRGVLNGLVFVSKKIGVFVADQINQTETMKKFNSQPPTPRMVALKNVANSSLEGALLIWETLEKSGTVILKQTKITTVDLVNKKYGFEVGNVTEKTLDTAADAALSAYLVSNIGLKTVAKTTAAETVSKVTQEDNVKNG